MAEAATKKATVTSIGSKDYRKSEWIETYVSAGYSLFQLNGKHPVKGQGAWQKTPYDPLLEGEDFPRNYGVVLREDDLVIDVDPRNFISCKEGRLVSAAGRPMKGDPAEYGLEEGETDNPVGRLFADCGMPSKPQTFIVKTGGGGLHIYYKKPPGFPHSMLLDKYPGVEFKTKGNYLVGPGSIHPDTRKPYTVTRGSIVDGVIDASPKLLALIQRDPVSSGKGLDDARDDSGTRNKYIAYLKRTPAAIEYCNGDTTTYKVAAQGRDFGLSLEVNYELMAQYYNPRCQPPWSSEELRGIVEHAYDYAKGGHGVDHPELEFSEVVDFIEDDDLSRKEVDFLRWENTRGGKDGGRPVKNDLGNTCNYFLTPDFEAYVNPLYRLLRYNEFSDQIEFNQPAPWHSKDSPVETWSDTDAIQLKYWLSQKKHYHTSAAICHEAAISLATTLYRYHPVKQYLDNLHWDGKPRLDTILSTYAGANNDDYTRAVSKCTFIAAVARVFEPGCQFDHILILEGKQGTGKSSFVRELGGPWYKDIVIDPHNKDTVDALKGAWVVEGSEMEFARRADVQALKAFITRVCDFARPAYARTTRAFPRSCVIIGTINPEIGGEYLRDTTGNRRFWPVATGEIDLKGLREDRDQIWAEAAHRYHAGEPFYLDNKKLVQAAEREQMARTVRDSWADIIEEWARQADEHGLLPSAMTAAQVGSEALNLNARGFDRTAQIRIANALTLLGWERGKYYVPNLRRSVSSFKPPAFDWIDDL